MSDTVQGINALRQRQNNLRDRLQKRKEQSKALLAAASAAPEDAADAVAPPPPPVEVNVPSSDTVAAAAAAPPVTAPAAVTVGLDPTMEHMLIRWLCDPNLLPVSAAALRERLQRTGEDESEVGLDAVKQTLSQFAFQNLLCLSADEDVTVVRANLNKLCVVRESRASALAGEASASANASTGFAQKRAPELAGEAAASKRAKSEADELDIDSLLQSSSVKETESQRFGQEINELLTSKTTKELSLMEKFKSHGGTRLKEFCKHATKLECRKQSGKQFACDKLHFRRIIRPHTDESLGDCSFLNTCFHVDTCKFVHYEVDYSRDGGGGGQHGLQSAPATVTSSSEFEHKLYPAQWVSCDIRTLDFTVLGKFSVVMADPPWDIHMELPYGTMSDEEMLRMNVTTLQDEGYIFLWVTGRAMELGRSCLDKWGYKRCDELIWVKTNQLQRLIRTGRTGHWLNHGKEHCLIGCKGTPGKTFAFNKGLDCDVLVAEVRATSHKPDEVYGVIERLAPGSRKCELFGRQHNTQPNWVTLGNQLDGVRLVDPDMVGRFKAAYPDGNCMKPQSTQK